MSEDKKIRPVSAGYIERAAMHYLGRFSSSASNLEAILLRKIQRRLGLSPANFADITGDHRKWIRDTIGKCIRLGYLDDLAYAKNRARLMLRRGKGLMHIRSDLKHKGVGADDIENAVADLTKDQVDPDLVAGINYARRRRFGPFQGDTGKTKPLEKQLQSMARTGIPYSVALKIISAESVQELEDEINFADPF